MSEFNIILDVKTYCIFMSLWQDLYFMNLISKIGRTIVTSDKILVLFSICKKYSLQYLNVKHEY
jgi:hypothetical protein